MQNIKKEMYLNEKEFNSFYKDAKELLFKEHIPAADKPPIAILTGGQPGSGKSGLVIKSYKDFQKLGITPIILDGDTYRGLYPNAKKIANETPDKYADITDTATGKVMEKLIEDSINSGYNFIREGTLNSAEIVDQLLESPNNYKIVIRLMATCREESILSCFERYILMKEKIGMGRFITIKSHDKRYYQFPKTAKIQELKGIPIEVYERGENTANPILLYNSLHYNNRLKSFDEALNYGRNHSYQQCKNNINHRILAIQKKLQQFQSNENTILEQLSQFKSEMDLKLYIEER